MVVQLDETDLNMYEDDGYILDTLGFLNIFSFHKLLAGYFFSRT